MAKFQLSFVMKPLNSGILGGGVGGVAVNY